MQKVEDIITDELVVRALEKNVAIIRFDVNRKVTYVNELFASLMGYRTEELYGKSHKEFCPPTFVRSAAYENFWKDLLAGKASKTK